MAGQSPGHSKWSRRLWRIIYGRFCDACVILWFNRGKVKSEAEWIQFPNFTRCTCRFYTGVLSLPPASFSWLAFFVKLSSSLNRPGKILLWVIHRKPPDEHFWSLHSGPFLLQHTAYDFPVCDEPTHVSVEITPPKEREIIIESLSKWHHRLLLLSVHKNIIVACHFAWKIKPMCPV